MQGGPGRPPKGLGHVRDLDGPEEQKARLEAILESLTGDVGVDEAAAKAGIQPARFHELRKQVLQAALDRLAPQPTGRPGKAAPSADSLRLAELEKRFAELEHELELSEIRSELAVAMPHLYRGKPGGASPPGADDRAEEGEPGTPEGAGKKGGPETRQQRRARLRKQEKGRR